MQVSTSVPCHHDGVNGCIYQVNVRDSHTRPNACWKCGGLDHFQKDYKVTVKSHIGDRDDTTLSDPSHTIGWINHTLTTSTPITDLTFKAILKEWVKSAIGNKRAFHPKLQTNPKTPIQPSISGAGQVVTPLVTTVTSTSLPPTTSLHILTATSPGSALHSVNPDRGPPQTWYIAVTSQSARHKANKPVTSQAVVQLLDVIDEVMEELQIILI